MVLKMIRIYFKEPGTPDWKKWCEECEEAQKSLNESHECGQPIEIVEKLYRKQKDFYFSLNGPFHGKCVYCETQVKADQPGDLDHFRPKKEVKNSGEIVIIVDEHGKERNHPGYYWLTYDFWNLLPSCEGCNRSNKRNEFPVREFRAYKPGDEKKEKAMLLNPVRDKDLEKHFRIDKTGTFIGLTERGKVTCDILDLNRPALAQNRSEAYILGKNVAYWLIVTALFKNHSMIDKENQQTIEKFKTGKAQYCAAGRAGMKGGVSKARKDINAAKQRVNKAENVISEVLTVLK